jgi:hypothetical protein
MIEVMHSALSHKMKDNEHDLHSEVHELLRDITEPPLSANLAATR